MKHIYVLCLLALAACRNNAITYAHQLDPCAQCSAIVTSPFGDSSDTAVCRTLHEIWTCRTDKWGEPECKVTHHVDEPLIADACYINNRK